MRPACIIAAFALTSFAAPVARYDGKSRVISSKEAIDADYNIESRAIRNVQRPESGKSRPVRSIEDENVDARGVNRPGNSKRSLSVPASTKGYNLDVGFSRFTDRSAKGEDSENFEARALRPNKQKGDGIKVGHPRSADESTVDARAIRNFQRSVEDEDNVEARAIRNRPRPGFKRSDDDGDVEARGVNNANNNKPNGGFWRNGERSADPEPVNRSGNSKRGVKAEAGTEKLQDVEARGTHKAVNNKPNGGFWRHGERSAEPEPINRIHGERSAEPEPINRIHGERSAEPEPINRIHGERREVDYEAESSADLNARGTKPPPVFTRPGGDKREVLTDADVEESAQAMFDRPSNSKRDPQNNCVKRSADPVFRCNG